MNDKTIFILAAIKKFFSEGLTSKKISLIISAMKVKYDSKIFSKEEIEEYIKIARERIPNLTQIAFRLEGDRVACDYVAHGQPFERIRRITGYLTGDLTSWNDAKRSEESERVKHTYR